jgi:hypothetical protein
MPEVLYREKRTLAQRGPVESREDYELPTPVLVGLDSVLRWTEDERDTGHDSCLLFPAWSDGKRAWVVRRDWCPAWGYSASGTEEEVIDFEAGVCLLIEHGVFHFPAPEISEYERVSSLT